MRRTTIIATTCSIIVAGATVAGAQSRWRPSDTVQPNDLGVVQAPVAGSEDIDLSEVPAPILHAAMVAFNAYEGGAEVTGASLDFDEIQAVYEVTGKTANGRIVEADVLPNGSVVELEVEIAAVGVPPHVMDALESFFPQFELASSPAAVEKSIRPSTNGLPEIWYEFSGSGGFDVEVRSDGRALLAEPE